MFSLYAATGAPGATATLRSLVYCGGGPVSGLAIQFAVDGGIVGSTVSNATGAAISYTIPADMTSGSHNVTVTFAGDATHDAASRTTAALAVKVPKRNVGFSLYATTAYAGATVTLKTLVYCGGGAVSGLTIQFAVDGGTVGSAVSGASGAALSYTIPAAMAAGLHNVTVSFAGDATHNAAARTTAALTVAETRAEVSFAFLADSMGGPPGVETVLKVVMYRVSDGQAVTGRTARLFVDGSPVGSATCGQYADMDCPYTIPPLMTAGLHNVTATFAGDATYAPSTVTKAALFVAGANYLDRSPWPMYRQNLQHTGVGIGWGAKGVLKWKYKTGGSVWSSPSISLAGFLVFGSDDGYVYVLNPDGTLAWRYLTGGHVRSSPVLSLADNDYALYVGSCDGYLYALRINCDLIWRKQLGYSSDYDYASPTIGLDGTLYAANAYAFALQRMTGNAYWQSNISYVENSPAIGLDGTVYFGNNFGTVVACDPIDGRVKWMQQTGNYVIAAPAVGPDGTVYVASTDYHIYALDAVSGTQRWCVSSDDVLSSPAIGTDGTVFYGSEDNGVYALDPTDGSTKWRYATGGRVQSSPAIAADGTIYVGSRDGKLYALNPIDGSLLWSLAIGTVGMSSPAIGADGTIYIGTEDGYLCAIQ